MHELVRLELLNHEEVGPPTNHLERSFDSYDTDQRESVYYIMHKNVTQTSCPRAGLPTVPAVVVGEGLRA